MPRSIRFLILISDETAFEEEWPLRCKRLLIVAREASRTKPCCQKLNWRLSSGDSLAVSFCLTRTWWRTGVEGQSLACWSNKSRNHATFEVCKRSKQRSNRTSTSNCRSSDGWRKPTQRWSRKWRPRSEQNCFILGVARRPVKRIFWPIWCLRWNTDWGQGGFRVWMRRMQSQGTSWATATTVFFYIY